MVRIAAAAAFAYWGGGFGANLLEMGKNALVKGAIGGFGAGLIASGGDFKSAVIGGFTGAGFGWVGGSGLSGTQLVFAHGVVGGVSSELSGGKFSSGFISSAFAKWATPEVTNAIGDNVVAKTVAMATVAGTASEIAGGKFANGAMSGAFAYLYNELSQNSAKDRHHLYNVKNSCSRSTPGCTYENVQKALRLFPNPGYDKDIPIEHGQNGLAKWGIDLGPVRYEDYGDSGIAIFTQRGHMLHPGVVRRWVGVSAERIYSIHPWFWIWRLS